MFLVAANSKRNDLVKTKYKVETLYHPSKQLLIKTLNERDWREASKLMKNDETWAKIPDENENLPIHLAVKFGGKKEIDVEAKQAVDKTTCMHPPQEQTCWSN